jgi:Holliday junction DNA helicase RuvB
MDVLKQDFWCNWEEFSKDLPESKGSALDIIIKPEILDLSNVEDGEGSNQYRPLTLDDYVGQDNAKARILSYIDGCKKNNEVLPHLFLSAPPGHGKSLLANIVANMMNKPIVRCVGGDLKSENIFVEKINDANGGIIFIDEANMIRKRVGFFMLPILEQFEIQGQKIKPFTAILATTHKGELSKDLDALIQRCELEIELEHYTVEQLVIILKQFKNKQYPNDQIDDFIYEQIAKNCKQTPRLARRLLRNYLFINDLDIVFKHNQIVKEGLTEIDVKILKYLNVYQKGASRNTISSYLRMKPQTYQYQYEPYLIFKEFIVIENKTKITEKGKQFLQSIGGQYV